MITNPKISIITVCFQAERTIEGAIQSVLSQKYSPIEYLIIDGGSSDKTLEIVNRYKQKINKLISEKDFGIYDAMNKGLRSATGDIICFLNADDKFYDQNVVGQVVAEFNKHNDADLIYGKLFFINIPKSLYFNPDEYNRERKGKLDMIIHAMPHQATFAKKDIFVKVGDFNPEYRIGADYDWFLRCANTGIKMHFIDEYLVSFSYEGLSYQKRYQHIPERVKLVYINASLMEFLIYTVLAPIRFVGKVFFEYVVWPIKKSIQPILKK